MRVKSFPFFPKARESCIMYRVTRVSTLVFLINVLHVYLFLREFSIQHALIRNNTFINFQEIILLTRSFKLINIYKGQKKGLGTLFYGLFLLENMIITKKFWIVLLNQKFATNFLLKDIPKFPTNMIIRNNTFINFLENFHPTCLFHPTLWLGTPEYIPYKKSSN